MVGIVQRARGISTANKMGQGGKSKGARSLLEKASMVLTSTRGELVRHGDGVFGFHFAIIHSPISSHRIAVLSQGRP
eukprot:1159784-Pelagomonas_calceolata.AAC.9